ncbi:hypothetical protein BGZ58_003106 [Dissophora ornata]|nr:hypothetical protein BGZ58_003106 [Dissophora ornata]
MTPRIIATLCLTSTGQTLNLHADSSLTIGRSTFAGITSPHVSRNQVQLTATASTVTITRLGTNRSLFNGKELPKNKPLVLHKGGLLTLLEHDIPISVEILPQELLSDGANETQSKVKQEGHHQLGRTTLNSLSPRINSHPASPHDIDIVPLDSPLGADRNNDTVIPISTHKAEVSGSLPDEDGSQSTSDSEDKDEYREQQYRGDISVESSYICEDLSELDGESNDRAGDDGSEHNYEKTIHLLN